MAVKVAINGFGRIGRNILRAIIESGREDIEVIAAGVRVLDALGVLDKTVLELNTLGDLESRAAYRDVLVTYFNDHVNDLSGDSRERLSRNPLRILDSKDAGDRRIVADAPLFADHLNEASVAFRPEAEPHRAKINPALSGVNIRCESESGSRRTLPGHS